MDASEDLGDAEESEAKIETSVERQLNRPHREKKISDYVNLLETQGLGFFAHRVRELLKYINFAVDFIIKSFENVDHPYAQYVKENGIRNIQVSMKQLLNLRSILDQYLSQSFENKGLLRIYHLLIDRLLTRGKQILKENMAAPVECAQKSISQGTTLSTPTTGSASRTCDSFYFRRDQLCDEESTTYGSSNCTSIPIGSRSFSNPELIRSDCIDDGFWSNDEDTTGVRSDRIINPFSSDVNLVYWNSKYHEGSESSFTNGEDVAFIHPPYVEPINPLVKQGHGIIYHQPQNLQVIPQNTPTSEPSIDAESKSFQSNWNKTARESGCGHITSNKKNSNTRIDEQLLKAFSKLEQKSKIQKAEKLKAKLIHLEGRNFIPGIASDYSRQDVNQHTFVPGWYPPTMPVVVETPVEKASQQDLASQPQAEINIVGQKQNVIECSFMENYFPERCSNEQHYFPSFSSQPAAVAFPEQIFGDQTMDPSSPMGKSHFPGDSTQNSNPSLHLRNECFDLNSTNGNLNSCLDVDAQGDKSSPTLSSNQLHQKASCRKLPEQEPQIPMTSVIEHNYDAVSTSAYHSDGDSWTLVKKRGRIPPLKTKNIKIPSKVMMTVSNRYSCLQSDQFKEEKKDRRVVRRNTEELKEWKSKLYVEIEASVNSENQIEVILTSRGEQAEALVCPENLETTHVEASRKSKESPTGPLNKDSEASRDEEAEISHATESAREDPGTTQLEATKQENSEVLCPTEASSLKEESESEFFDALSEDDEIGETLQTKQPKLKALTTNAEQLSQFAEIPISETPEINTDAEREPQIANLTESTSWNMMRKHAGKSNNILTDTSKTEVCNRYAFYNDAELSKARNARRRKARKERKRNGKAKSKAEENSTSESKALQSGSEDDEFFDATEDLRTKGALGESTQVYEQIKTNTNDNIKS